MTPLRHNETPAIALVSVTSPAKGDGESWEVYAHRLEHRIKEQRDHIKAITELRNEPGDRAARKRIEWLERALGSMTLRWERATADFAGYRDTHGAEAQGPERTK